MATLNELGRNSAALTYGPFATGQDLFPTLTAVDAWLRNDTWQGYATASSTAVSGVNTIWTTQARAGDYIMIAGQQRIVASVISDTSLTVTVAFNPAITLPSAVKVISSVQPSLTGTLGNTVRGDTAGLVYCTAGSTTISGVGTYFLAEATNSVTLVSISNGTVAIDTSGNITGVGTTFVDQQGFTNGLYPGDSIAVVSNGATYYFVVATVSSNTAATVVSAPTTAIASGSAISKATNGVIGRTVNINGRIRLVTAIASNTSMTVNAAMDFTDSNLNYKVYPRGTLANASSAAGTVYGTTSATGTGTNLTVAATVTGIFLPGAVITGVGVPVGTTILNQQYGATGSAVVNTTASATSATNVLTVASATSIVVGQLISGNGATVAGIPVGTYVTSVNGTTVTISQNVTAPLSTTAVYFFTPGGAGVYTSSAATTISAAACAVSSLQGVGTNFFWDLGTVNSNTPTSTTTLQQVSANDQVWIGDEVRTLGFNSVLGGGTVGALNAYVTDYAGYSGVAVGALRQTVFGINFKREDSYINGNTGTQFTSELRIGDDIIIDGTECTVTNIINDRQFKVNFDFTHGSTSSVVYKKLKIHGYTLEGTREGGPGTSGKFSQSTTMLATTGTVYQAGQNTITVAAAATSGPTYNFVKISGAGGPPLVMTGQINTVSASSTITGVNTLFTSQLHVGAELVIAGQYVTVTAIASDVSLTVSQTVSVTGPVPYYRSVPLYTYITAGSTTITLASPIKNTIYANGANPPTISYPSTGGDFIEYVYSSPNAQAESSTTTVLNQSFDRKFVAFRMFPLFQSTNAVPTATSTITTAFGAYSMPVYERWAAGYAGTHGVGINMADLSGGVMVSGTQATTTLSLTNPICGSLQTNMAVQGLGTGVPNTITALASGTAGLASSTYTLGSASFGTAGTIFAASLNGVYDITAMTQLTGGYIYLFATKRYAILQGKSFANVQTQWVGCLEFERAQPEDITGSSGLGTTSGITYGGTYGGTQLSQGASPPNITTPGFSQSIQYTPGAAPWPCFAYVNGNRFPTGSSQIPTLPVLQTYAIHGGVLSTPRVRNQAGDLVGFNSHIYSACTITTGRWGHQIEFGALGSYNNAFTAPTVGSSILTNVINQMPQIHLGQILPVYTNIYNAKRFMFSPVVVLGPAYDPDIRGRLYGLKVIPSALGTLMDTVSVTVNASTYFYDAGQPAVDHWVIGTPPSATLTTAYPGQTVVSTARFTTTQNSGQIQQSWRSLEDVSTQATNGSTTFTNNFRMAVPA